MIKTGGVLFLWVVEDCSKPTMKLATFLIFS